MEIGRTAAPDLWMGEMRIFEFRTVSRKRRNLEFASSQIRQLENLQIPRLLHLNNRQIYKARLVCGMINPLRGFAIILWLGPEDIRHERLRIAIV